MRWMIRWRTEAEEFELTNPDIIKRRSMLVRQSAPMGDVPLLLYLGAINHKLFLGSSYNVQHCF